MSQQATTFLANGLQRKIIGIFLANGLQKNYWFFSANGLHKNIFEQTGYNKNKYEKNQNILANKLHKYRYIKTFTLHLDSETLCK